MPLHRILAAIMLLCVPLVFCMIAFAHPNHAEPGAAGIKDVHVHNTNSSDTKTATTSRATVLMISLTVFVLAIFIGFEVIAKVPPTLHTPLMSGSNAISGITVVGAIIVAGFERTDFATWLGVVAVILANINVVGGFVVTHRMLLMFKRR